MLAPLLLVAATLASLPHASADEAAVRSRLDSEVAAVGGGAANPADDATFLRRSWINLAGRTPPAPSARAFLDDPDPAKRSRLVQSLLESEEFNDHWGRVLVVMLTSERPTAREGYDGRVLHDHLRDRLRARDPYDRVVRELIAGSGASDSSGPANFLLRYDADPARLAGAVGKDLLGVTVRCAQCHDHPFARWTEEDFWGLAAAFARVRKLESGDDEGLMAIVEARRGELTRPDPNAKPEAEPEGEAKDEGEPPAPEEIIVRPRFLDGKSLPAQDRRAALADLVISPRNKPFARNLVNRVWEQMHGRALVANLDDPSAKPDALPVLELLAEDFASHGHDLRRLLRIVALSRTFGQKDGPSDGPRWARPWSRPMTVDQLHGSIAGATGHDGAPDEEAAEPEEDGDDTEGDDDDLAADALGERAMTLQRALVLLNGEFVREASRSGARIARATHGRAGEAAILESAFLATLGRRPTADEAAMLRSMLSRPGGLEDLYWILLNSSEFQVIP